MSGEAARITRLVRRVKDGDVSVSTGRKQTVLTHMRATRKPCRARDIAALIGVDWTPCQILVELMAEGLIRKVRVGRAHCYELDSAHPDNQPTGGTSHGSSRTTSHRPP